MLKGLLLMTLAGDGQETCYVLYDKADGQIYLRKFSTTWSAEERLTTPRENSYPSVRWSFNSNPPIGVGRQADYVWTSKTDGHISVMYNKLAIQQSTQKTEGDQLLLSLGVAGVAVGIISFFTSLHRKRSVSDIRD